MYICVLNMYICVLNIYKVNFLIPFIIGKQNTLCFT